MTFIVIALLFRKANLFVVSTLYFCLQQSNYSIVTILSVQNDLICLMLFTIHSSHISSYCTIESSHIIMFVVNALCFLFRVAMLLLGFNQCALNSSQVLGHTQVMMRHLYKTGYIVCLVCDLFSLSTSFSYSIAVVHFVIIS